MEKDLLYHYKLSPVKIELVTRCGALSFTSIWRNHSRAQSQLLHIKTQPTPVKIITEELPPLEPTTPHTISSSSMTNPYDPKRGYNALDMPVSWALPGTPWVQAPRRPYLLIHPVPWLPLLLRSRSHLPIPHPCRETLSLRFITSCPQAWRLNLHWEDVRGWNDAYQKPPSDNTGWWDE